MIHAYLCTMTMYKISTKTENCCIIHKYTALFMILDIPYCYCYLTSNVLSTNITNFVLTRLGIIYF